ncbi:MAG: autotransporter-associated beta strand repeat-containing protein, partial [Phycisphaerae bacterium]
MKTSTKRFHRALMIAGAVAAAIGFLSPAARADVTWKGDGATTNWSLTANWDAALVSGSNIQFAWNSDHNYFQNINTYNDLTGVVLGNITDGIGTNYAGNVILAGNAITLNGNVSNGQTWGSALTINLNLANNGNTTTYTTTGGNIAVGGTISGTGGITKAGTPASRSVRAFPVTDGILTLSGTNTFTGVTTINAGTVSVATINNGGVAGNLGQAGNAASNLVFGGTGYGGTLQYTGADASTDRGFTINNGCSGTFDIT